MWPILTRSFCCCVKIWFFHNFRWNLLSPRYFLKWFFHLILGLQNINKAWTGQQEQLNNLCTRHPTQTRFVSRQQTHYLTRADLYFHYCITDLITPHCWSCCTELLLWPWNFTNKRCEKFYKQIDRQRIWNRW